MENDAREVNIQEMLKMLLRKYKQVLAAGLLGILLLSVYNIVQQNDSTDVAYELTEEEKSNVKSILPIYDKLYYYEKYYENSLYIQENSYEQKYVRLQFYIDSEYVFNLMEPAKADYTSALVTLYSDYVKSNMFVEGLTSIYGDEVETLYVSELVSVSTSERLLTVNILKTNGIEIGDIRNTVVKLVSSKEEEFSKVGEHSIELINVSEELIASSQIENVLTSTLDNISTCRMTIEETLASFSNSQKVYLKEMLEIAEYKEEIEVIGINQENGFLDAINGKMIFLGFLVGIIIACMVYCIIMIFSDKLQFTDDMIKVYGIHQYGYIKKAKNINLIDVENVSKAIDLYCKKNNIKKMALMVEEIDKEVIEKLVDILKLSGIIAEKVEYKKNDSSYLGKAIECENVVMVEQIGESRYSSIRKQLENLKMYDINLLGAVIITNF